MRRDLIYAFRQLTSHPGISIAAILTLAIGMALNAVAFTAVNSFLFKGRTGAQVEGAGWVLDGGGRSAPGDQGISPAEFERLTAATAGALTTAVEGRTPLARQNAGTTEAVWALLVSSAYFQILDATPLAGRLLSSSDGTAAAVVSERFWRDRLDAAPIGSTTVTLNGLSVPVIGVLPDSFAGPGGLYEPELFLPYEARRVLQLPKRLEQDTTRWLTMFGRLAPGVTIAEIDVRLKTGADAIAKEWPKTHAGRTARFRLFKDRHPEAAGLAWIAAAGMAAVGLVLLIACFNVANMLLARAIERRREMAIRTALGASRLRIVRQQITESLLLAMLAGLSAAVVAIWAQELMSVFAIPVPMPQRVNLTPDYRVMLFVAVMVVAAGILPALAPALQATKLNLVTALSAQGHSGSGGRPSPARQGLMIVQVAGSTAFLIVAALFGQSFIWTANIDPGFETERAIALSLDPSAHGHTPESARVTIDGVVERLRSVPGIEGVAVASRIPFYIGFARLTEVADGEQQCANEGCPTVDTYAIGPTYFATMGIPVVRGREFEAASSEPNGVVINEVFAKRWFPSGNAVGQTLRIGDLGEPRVVIGVSRQTLLRGFPERAAPALYLPIASSDYESAVAIVVRTTGDPSPLVRAVAEAVYQVDSKVPLMSLRTMTEVLELPRWPWRTASLFFGVCGVLALLLATTGLVAVMSHAVNQRMREFGVRVAVGATSRQLLRDVIGSGLRVVAPGVAVGLVAAVLLSRAVRSMLVGVGLADPMTYIAIALLQAVIALAACLVPARRAMRVDPLVALRSE